MDRRGLTKLVNRVITDPHALTMFEYGSIRSMPSVYFLLYTINEMDGEAYYHYDRVVESIEAGEPDLNPLLELHPCTVNVLSPPLLAVCSDLCDRNLKAEKALETIEFMEKLVEYGVPMSDKIAQKVAEVVPDLVKESKRKLKEVKKEVKNSFQLI